MKKSVIVLLGLIFANPLQVLAGGFDNQFRLLGHGQWFLDELPVEILSGRLGVSGWVIISDATNPKPRGLFLAGPFYESKDKERSAEFMGGTSLKRGRRRSTFRLPILGERVV